MKVAITGATGFVGKHVLQQLLKHNVAITVLARDFSKALPESDLIRLVKFDIKQSPSDIYELAGEPDTLIHLAWEGVQDYTSLQHIESQLGWHYSFLKNMIVAGVDNVFVAGTCFEYGVHAGVLNEHLPTSPNTAYGLAKDTLRKQLELLKKQHEFNLVWGRLFYMYGTGQSEKSLFQSLKNSAERNEQFFNMSAGQQQRDYLPVQNVAEYITQLSLSKIDAGIVNISSGKSVKIEDLVRSWIDDNKWNIHLNLGHFSYSEFEPLSSFYGNNNYLHTILKNIDIDEEDI